MTEHPHEEVRRLFDLLIDMPSDQRALVLERECGGDRGLKNRILAMIAAAEDDRFLDQATAEKMPVGWVSPSTVAKTPREQAGQTIGRYKLLQLIGEGGFGTVWMAEQREPVKRRVALKIIKLGMDTRQVIARFEAERQALAMMDHPNIAKVLDAGSTDTGRPYFVMELVKGVPITDFCDTENLAADERLELFVSVCNAAQHAHQKGIIHRDIKPSNVLITLHDGKPVVKVIDFGIAKAINRELTDKTLFTEFNQFIGTPQYMSPEQAEMSGLDIDTRSDIYSLGVLLYELLTGMTPFDPEKLRSAALNEIQRIIREEEPPRPSMRLSGANQAQEGINGADKRSSMQYISKHRRTDPRSLTRKLRGDLDWIVMKALEKDRARRYETANGFAMDIQRYLKDEPVTASPPSASYKFRKLIRRNKGAFTAAAVVFIALTLGIVGTTWGLVTAKENEATAKAEAKRAERELARANEVKRLITDMFHRIKPHNARGADITLLKNILDDTAARLASGEIKDELNAAELRTVIGSAYRCLTLYEDAERQLSVAVETLRRLCGEQCNLTLWAKTELAIVYLEQARYAEAERLFANILEDRTHCAGNESDATLGAMNNLASVYQNQGKYDQAERVLLELREIQQRSPESDPTIGLTELGNLYYFLSRYSESVSAYVELIEQMRRKGLFENPETIGAMQNLALAYGAMGRNAEAVATYEEALELADRILGPKHRTTAIIKANLGGERCRQNRLEEAETLLTEALSVYQEVLEEKHPLKFMAMAELAGLRAQQGRYAEAEALHRQIVESTKEVHGARHMSTLGPMTNFGWYLLARGRFDEAREMFETTLPIKREELGNDHHFTRIAKRGLAQTYDALERPKDALPLWKELLDYDVRTADELDADALNSAAWELLTSKHEELRDPARALPLSERACALEESNAGENLWMYLDTLALAQHRTGDIAGAVETQKRAISLMPPDHAERADIEGRLAEYEGALVPFTQPANAPATREDR